MQRLYQDRYESQLHHISFPTAAAAPGVHVRALLCGYVAVDNEENDDYNVVLMVFYHWLLVESAIYPYSGAFPCLSNQTVPEV